MKFWRNVIAGVILIVLFIFAYRHIGPEYAQAIGFTMIIVTLGNIEEKLK